MPPKKQNVVKKLVAELPQVPKYEPLIREEHDAVGLPVELCTTPLDVFSQLFTVEMWESLCKNTNAYYHDKASKASLPPDVRPRPWKDTTVGELKVWLGLVLYMGVVTMPSIPLYWEGTTRQQPMSAMGLNRFCQIKRYLHVSPPPKPANPAAANPDAANPDAANPAAKPQWWEKMEPMSSIAQERVKACYTPSTNVAIDEMMVKCEGRSIHTLTMPNKPIDHGYKLFALAEHGYTYSWVYYSPAIKADASKGKLTIVPFGCVVSGSAGMLWYQALLAPWDRDFMVSGSTGTWDRGCMLSGSAGTLYEQAMLAPRVRGFRIWLIQLYRHSYNPAPYSNVTNLSSTCSNTSISKV